jgi:hypothetical protein
MTHPAECEGIRMKNGLAVLKRGGIIRGMIWRKKEKIWKKQKNSLISGGVQQFWN